MLRFSAVSQTVCRRALAPFAQPALGGKRMFGESLTIPTDREQQAGRRKEEMDAEAAGGIGFNRDPIVPASDAGTKENPIQVPSGAHCRVVGYEDPVSHQLVWFNLNAGPLHYLPDIGLYFKLKKI